MSTSSETRGSGDEPDTTQQQRSSVSQAAPTTMPAVATSRVFFASLSAAQPLTAAQVDSGTGAHRALLSSSSTATPPRGRLERLISATAREVERELARAREQDSTAQQHPHDGDETISPSHQQDPSGGSRALRNIARGAGRYYARSKVSFPASVFPPLLAEEGHLESGHCGRGQRIGKRCFTNARRICKRCQVGTCGRYARMHAVNRYMYCIVR